MYPNTQYKEWTVNEMGDEKHRKRNFNVVPKLGVLFIMKQQAQSTIYNNWHTIKYVILPF